MTGASPFKPSPLVGEVGGGPAASAAEENRIAEGTSTLVVGVPQ
jgi:hypothetical protein